MRLTIDTSVAVKLVLSEPGSDAARALAASDVELIAPDLIQVEMTNAFWANAVSGRITPEVATELATVWQPLIGRFYRVADILREALHLAFLLDHAVCDCIFLALAIREDAPLVTADRRFLKLLSTTALAHHARALA